MRLCHVERLASHLSLLALCNGLAACGASEGEGGHPSGAGKSSAGSSGSAAGGGSGGTGGSENAQTGGTGDGGSVSTAGSTSGGGGASGGNAGTTNGGAGATNGGAGATNGGAGTGGSGVLCGGATCAPGTSCCGPAECGFCASPDLGVFCGFECEDQTGAGGAGGAAGAAGTAGAQGTSCGSATCGVNQFCRAPCCGAGDCPPQEPTCTALPEGCEGVASCACICGQGSPFCRDGEPSYQCGCA
jgi:hypothetical protein